MRRDIDLHLTDEELLSLIDGELRPQRTAHATMHVETCAACQARRDQIGRVMGLIAGAYRQDVATVEIVRARQTLHISLTETRRRLDHSWRRVLVCMQAATPAWCLLAVIALGLLVVSGPTRSTSLFPHFAAAETGALPIASLTPGATLPLGTAELCSNQRGPRQHRLPSSMREDVLRRYGMEHLDSADYELDFLITPELGGAPDPANLWPERYRQPVWNAHVKDQLEDLLPRLVCTGRLRLDVAQRDIATDWIAAYRKYFDTPAPLTATVSPPRDYGAEIVFEDGGQSLLALAVLRPPSTLRNITD
jgi:hypothetical protein